MAVLVGWSQGTGSTRQQVYQTELSAFLDAVKGASPQVGGGAFASLVLLFDVKGTPKTKSERVLDRQSLR